MPMQYTAAAQPTVHQKQYRNFLGVDLTNGVTEVDNRRSPYAPNMISDLSGFPEKRPGYKSVLASKLGARIYGVFPFLTSTGQQLLVMHAGTNLYCCPVAEMITPALVYSGMAAAPSTYYVMRTSDITLKDSNGNLPLCIYIMDGTNFLRYSGTGNAVTVDSVAYIPTTTISAPPTGGGTKLETRNLMQPKCKNTMLGDGGVCTVTTITSGSSTVVLVSSSGVKAGMTIVGTNIPANTTVTNVNGDGKTITISQNASGSSSSGTVTIGSLVWYIDTTNVDSINTVEVMTVTNNVQGWSTLNVGTDYTVDTNAGKITFSVPHPTPISGTDNIRVTFTKIISGYANMIKNCTIAAFYGIGSDNRIFVSGNPNYRNRDWMSGLANPEYFPDDAYAIVGSENSAIMGYLKQYDSLVIVKEDSDQDATQYLRTATIGTDGKTVTYPLKQGLVGVGAVSKYTFSVLADDPLFLSKNGVYGVESSAVTYERTTQLRSYYVNAALKKEGGLASAMAAVWNGWYCLFINSNVYVANSQQKNQNMTGSTGYEWFFWDSIPAVCVHQCYGNLYFGTIDGDICKFTAYGDYGLAAYWNGVFSITGVTITSGSAIVTCSSTTGLVQNAPAFGTGIPTGAFIKSIDSTTQFTMNTTATGSITSGTITAGKSFTCRWSTKMDDLGDWMRYKTVMKRGVGILVKPYVATSGTIYYANEANTQIIAATPPDTTMVTFNFAALNFSKFSFNPVTNPRVIPVNHKLKNTELLQVIVENSKGGSGFGLYGIEIRYMFTKDVKK